MADSKITSGAPKIGAGQGQAASPAKNAAAGIARDEAPAIFRLPKFFSQSAEPAVATPPAPEPALADPNADVASSGASAAPSRSSVVGAELAAMREEIERLTEQITQVNERESSLERVFDTLHAELSDYKNDFLYEHLKPVVRPLLFLFDSIEQFDSEVAMTQSAAPNPASALLPGTLAAATVRENVEYFRDQLVEALQVCEVTIMEAPRGAFNAKLHKAVDVMPVPQEQDGTIVRVVRSGWFLNGQLLRPAEVVVGKFRAPTKAPATGQNAATKP